MQDPEKHYKDKTNTEIKEVTFCIGEKVLASGKTWTVSNKHPTKNVYFLKLPDGKGWWFDEKLITKITPEKVPAK